MHPTSWTCYVAPPRVNPRLPTLGHLQDFKASLLPSINRLINKYFQIISAVFILNSLETSILVAFYTARVRANRPRHALSILCTLVVLSG
jgi:hypothetical protein